MSIETVKKLDWRIFRNVIGAVLLLVIAILAPIFARAVFYLWTPGTDTLAQWLERSGAIMTIYSAIAAAVSRFSMDLISQSEEITAREASTLTKKYTKIVQAIEGVSLLVTLLGTLVWGYGSFVLKFYHNIEKLIDGAKLPFC